MGLNTRMPSRGHLTNRSVSSRAAAVPHLIDVVLRSLYPEREKSSGTSLPRRAAHWRKVGAPRTPDSFDSSIALRGDSPDILFLGTGVPFVGGVKWRLTSRRNS